MDEVLPGSEEAPLLHRDIARHLDHPCFVRMRGYPSHMHLPTAQVDEKQHGICYEPPQRPDLGGEEVRRHEDVEMGADACLPRGGGPPLWSRRDPMALD